MWKHSGNFGNVFKLLTHIGGRLTILILNGLVALGIVISPSSDVNDNLIGKCKILFIKQPHGVSKYPISFITDRNDSYEHGYHTCNLF